MCGVLGQEEEYPAEAVQSLLCLQWVSEGTTADVSYLQEESCFLRRSIPCLTVSTQEFVVSKL